MFVVAAVKKMYLWVFYGLALGEGGSGIKLSVRWEIKTDKSEETVKKDVW